VKSERYYTILYDITNVNIRSKADKTQLNLPVPYSGQRNEVYMILMASKHFIFWLWLADNVSSTGRREAPGISRGRTLGDAT